jgi:hypothetical protein
MATDALSRRLRFAAPAPKPNDAIYPQDADREQWAAISKHGPLPISYLYFFSSRTNYANLQKRCTRFFHQGFLTRPPRQFASFHARYSPLVYDLSPKAKAQIKACSLPPSRSAPFVHQLMQACFTASLELEYGDSFLSRDQLLEADSLALPLLHSRLIPDDVFALKLADGKKRFFLLEIDRNTESIERSVSGYNTWKKKVADYDVAMQGYLKRAWGIPLATVLVVTTNETHAQNIAAYVKENSRYADRWQFRVEPTFGANWRTPKDPLASAKGII